MNVNASGMECLLRSSRVLWMSKIKKLASEQIFKIKCRTGACEYEKFNVIKKYKLQVNGQWHKFQNGWVGNPAWMCQQQKTLTKFIKWTFLFFYGGKSVLSWSEMW